MKATRTHQWTSLLLSGALVAGMMITPSLAAGGAELEFQYPSDVKAEDVTITVHEGVPADSGEDAVKALPEVKKRTQRATIWSASPAHTATGSGAMATTMFARSST